MNVASQISQSYIKKWEFLQPIIRWKLKRDQYDWLKTQNYEDDEISEMMSQYEEDSFASIKLNNKLFEYCYEPDKTIASNQNELLDIFIEYLKDNLDSKGIQKLVKDFKRYVGFDNIQKTILILTIKGDLELASAFEKII